MRWIDPLLWAWYATQYGIDLTSIEVQEDGDLRTVRLEVIVLIRAVERARGWLYGWAAGVVCGVVAVGAAVIVSRWRMLGA